MKPAKSLLVMACDAGTAVNRVHLKLFIGAIALDHAVGVGDAGDAAKVRIKNVFESGCKVYLSFSSGKDSLCMASVTYDLIREGAISAESSLAEGLIVHLAWIL